MSPTFSPEIRRILLNFLTRRWLSLVWIGSFYLLASFAVVKALADDPESKLNSARFIFPMSVSFWLVLIDVSAKPIRSLLALPVTANSLWNSYWWLTFGLPAIAFTLISILGLAGAWMTGPLALPFDKVLILIFEQWGALALGWCCLSLLPSGDDVTKHRPISSTIAGAFRGLQMALFVFVIPNSFLWQSIILGVSGCTIATALFGKKITGQFILERIGRPDYPFKPVSSRRSSERVIGTLGWMALVRSFSMSIVGLVCWGIAYGILSLLANPNIKEIRNVHPMITLPLVTSILVSNAFSGSVRVLRQLPIDRSGLSLILLLPASLPIIIAHLGFAAVALAFQSELLELWLRSMFTGRVLLAIAIYNLAIVLHAPSDKWLKAAVFVAVGVPLTLLVGAVPLALDSNMIKGCAFVFACVPAFYWTRWEISSGRTAYQSPVTNTDPIST